MEEYFIENIRADNFICLKLKKNNTDNTSHYLLEEHIKNWTVIYTVQKKLEFWY